MGVDSSFLNLKPIASWSACLPWLPHADWSTRLHQAPSVRYKCSHDITLKTWRHVWHEPDGKEAIARSLLELYRARRPTHFGSDTFRIRFCLMHALKKLGTKTLISRELFWKISLRALPPGPSCFSLTLEATSWDLLWQQKERTPAQLHVTQWKQKLWFIGTFLSALARKSWL